MKDKLPRRIIVFCLPGIGDAVLFTPALHRLRQLFPQAHITVLTMFSGTAQILATNPDLNEVRSFDFFNSSAIDSIRYLWNLRCENYDLSIMAFPSNRLEYNLVNWFVGKRWAAAHRCAHHSWRNCWFLNNITVDESDVLHNVEENLRLINAIADRLGVGVQNLPAERKAMMRQFPLKLLLSEDARQYADSFFTKHGFEQNSLLFGFHTFSSTFKNMTRKCWDKEKFVELIRRLSDQYADAHFLIFSGPADADTSEHIAKHGGSRAVLIQERDLSRAVAIQSRCRVFITNDSGVMHLAAAAGVPVVALFGPTNWRRLHPWTQQHLVVRQDLPCMPCFYYSTRPLRCAAETNYACMRDLPVANALSAVTQLINTTGHLRGNSGQDVERPRSDYGFAFKSVPGGV